jgi:hypothetical protein
MDFTAVTALQIALAIVAIALGAGKALRPYEEAVESFSWLNNVSPQAARSVGWAEVLFGAALVVPTALGFSTWIAIGVASVFGAFALVIAALYVARREHLRGLPQVGIVVASLVLMVGLI